MGCICENCIALFFPAVCSHPQSAFKPMQIKAHLQGHRCCSSRRPLSALDYHIFPTVLFSCNTPTGTNCLYCRIGVPCG